MSSERPDFRPGDPRSKGAIPQRRVPQAWPKERRFRLLCLDGGGIRGIFPAVVLAELERRYAGNHPLSAYFDLVAGTSTGGIIALGLGASIPPAELADLYIRRGKEIFPPYPETTFGRLRGSLRKLGRYARYSYDEVVLRQILEDILGERRFGSSALRLTIPAFDGKHGEVFVYKTPHHRDYKFDRLELMVDVALATAAAPTSFRPHRHGGYILVDGGIWANNPIMLAIVEALTCFDLDRAQIDVLSIGCGNDPYLVSSIQVSLGGIWFWRNIFEAQMRLQSSAATNQARLLLGPPAVLRLEPPPASPPIELDDWRRAVEVLEPAARILVDQQGDAIARTFLQGPADPFIPVQYPD